MLPVPALLRSYLAEPSFYGGRRTSIVDRVKRRTCLKTFSLTHAQVQHLRTVAKQNEVSIHALLHAAAIHSIETELSIKTSTPINLRPSIPSSSNSNGQRRVIANYVCSHTSFMPRREKVLDTARAYYAELNAPAARHTAKADVAVLQYVNNSLNGFGRPGIEQIVLDRLQTPNPHCLNYTLEVSNLGNVLSIHQHIRHNG